MIRSAGSNAGVSTKNEIDLSELGRLQKNKITITKMYMTITREDKVNEFRRAAGKGNKRETPQDEQVVWTCLAEEFVELADAGREYVQTPSDNTRANFVKEWADAQYVLSQIAVFYDIPADAAFNRVHNSNMTKTVEGKVLFREDGKILKPDTYVAPDMGGL